MKYIKKFNESNQSDVNGTIPTLVELSSILEDAIEHADSQTSNWYKTFQDFLIDKGFAVIKVDHMNERTFSELD